MAPSSALPAASPARTADTLSRPTEDARVEPATAIEQVRATLAGTLFPLERERRTIASGLSSASAVSPRTPKSQDVSGALFPPLGSGSADEETLPLLFSHLDRHLDALAAGSAPLIELVGHPYTLTRRAAWFNYSREDHDLDKKLAEFLSPALDDTLTSLRTHASETWQLNHDLPYASAEGVKFSTTQGDGALFPLGAQRRGFWYEIKAANEKELRELRTALVALSEPPQFVVREEKGHSVVYVLKEDGSDRPPTKTEKLLLQVLSPLLRFVPLSADCYVLVTQLHSILGSKKARLHANSEPSRYTSLAVVGESAFFLVFGTFTRHDPKRHNLRATPIYPLNTPNPASPTATTLRRASVAAALAALPDNPLGLPYDDDDDFAPGEPRASSHSSSLAGSERDDRSGGDSSRDEEGSAGRGTGGADGSTSGGGSGATGGTGEDSFRKRAGDQSGSEASKKPRGEPQDESVRRATSSADATFGVLSLLSCPQYTVAWQLCTGSYRSPVMEMIIIPIVRTFPV